MIFDTERRKKTKELYRMAESYEYGSEVCSRNIGKAIEYYRILADMGESQAISKIRELSPKVVIAKSNVVESGKYQSSRSNTDRLNNPHNLQLYEMAQRFEYGTDVCAKNLNRAIEYYKILADKGEGIARRKLEELGVCYYVESPSNKVANGSSKGAIYSDRFDVGRKSDKVKELYRMAESYEYGSEVCSRNIGKAVEYYRNLADMGESQAISKIRELSPEVVVAKSNVVESGKYQTSRSNTCRLNNPQNLQLYEMAQRFEYGTDVCAKNLDRAIEYYKILADKGEKFAEQKIEELSVNNKPSLGKSIIKTSISQKNKPLRVIDILSQVTGTDFRKDSRIPLELGNSIILPVIVAGTMSSGKSTLLNAILGCEILPSMNQACTNYVLKIMDIRGKESTLIVAFNDGKKSVYNNAELRDVALANKMEDVKDVVLLYHGDFCKGGIKNLMFVDTPGINNNDDLRHMIRTKEELKNYSKAVIIYVLNSEQIGTKDDSEFLQFVFKLQKTEKDIDIVFVVNKVDRIDSEKEGIADFQNLCRNYLQNIGFHNPKIFMVSSLMSFLSQKAMEKSPMTRCEKLMLRNFVDYCVADVDTYSGEIEKTGKDGEYPLSTLKSVFMNSGISDVLSEFNKIIKSYM